ncbi:phage tail tape measure protein [Magnetospirillum fulvum]|uniref:TP901 family phage tail tape measure protein n=1 Tax=Magnetospirillum fulvum MGU-K5 TaxID=1316936 RepID=S9TGE4_MAGFU|nr:phage tail tape measure protein [Magnetospirillum fulvum]EPY01351.1 TP901 family phage tail tape measure protein [Magnetospirillum fulvum MGU-K5]
MSLATNIIIGAALAGGFNSTIGSAVGGIGQINRAAGELSGTLVQVGQAWASLHGIGSALNQASDFEHELKQAGITADMTNEQIAGLKDQLRGLAVPERTNQSMQELLKGFSALVSAGMDKDKTSAMVEALGRTATAAQANVDDLAKTAFVLNDTLGVAPEGMGKALDQLAFAGKQGAFELKDMARYFPTLGAAAKGLGLQGTEAVTTLGAALQIAKKGAADPSEAANNMKNFMAKIMAPETLKKFKEHGVDLVKVRNEAIAKGGNPFEALLEQVNKKTKGGQVDLLGQFFGDMQVQDFLKPMLANLEEYKRLKGDIAGASGTVDTDFARMMETNKELLKGFNSQLGKLGEAVGSALLPPFNMALKAITPVVTVLGDMANSSPTATAAIVSVGAAFTLLPPAITLTTVAWRVLSASVMANPIGLAIGAIAVGAGLIIDNWGTVKLFFSTIWNGVEEHWRTILAFTGPIGWAAIKIIDNWGQLKTFAMGMWEGISAKWAGLVDAVTPVGEAITGIFTSVWGNITKVWDDGVATIMAIWDKVRGPLTDFATMMGWVAPKGESMPKVGAAVAANDNPANDNQVKPGSGIKAAEAKGAQVVTKGSDTSAAGQAGGQAVAQASAATPQRIEVVLTLPPGMRADVRGSTPGVSVIARTGQSMAGGN